MNRKTIAVLHPGEMGAALGASCRYCVLRLLAGFLVAAVDIHQRLERFKDTARAPALAEITAAFSRPFRPATE